MKTIIIIALLLCCSVAIVYADASTAYTAALEKTYQVYNSIKGEYLKLNAAAAKLDPEERPSDIRLKQQLDDRRKQLIIQLRQPLEKMLATLTPNTSAKRGSDAYGQAMRPIFQKRRDADLLLGRLEKQLELGRKLNAAELRTIALNAEEKYNNNILEAETSRQYDNGPSSSALSAKEAKRRSSPFYSNKKL